MKVVAIALIVLVIQVSGSSAQSREFLPRELKERIWLDLAGGIAAKVEGIPPDAYSKEFKPAGLPVAVRLSVRGPAEGFGILTTPSTNPKMSGVKLTIGQDVYAPLMVDHPSGTDNVHKTEAPGNSISMLQGWFKGEDYVVFLFDVPQSAKGAPAKVEIPLMLGRLIDESKGEFRISIQFVAAP